MKVQGQFICSERGTKKERNAWVKKGSRRKQKEVSLVEFFEKMDM